MKTTSQTQLDGSDQDKPQKTEKILPQQRSIKWWALIILITFFLGNFSGYLYNERRSTGRQQEQASPAAHTESDMAQMARQVNPPDGYQLNASFGDIGPRLLAAGAMEYDVFLQVYEKSGAPLNPAQQEILKNGSSEQVIINRENAYFLLNFFWALGLTNKNPILTEGPMVTKSQGQIENFASTGGWSIAAKPIKELYASAEIISLTAEQQEHLDHVAQNVYRPCCNNPVHFPDCNHGMAMLGLLQLMASQGATEDEMFEAAKYVNAFWYPSQNLEVAAFFKASMNLDFDDVEPRQIVGRNISSGSGYQSVRQWLDASGLLNQTPGGGASCGV
jgi:hypothetical protein